MTAPYGAFQPKKNALANVALEGPQVQPFNQPMVNAKAEPAPITQPKATTTTPAGGGYAPLSAINPAQDLRSQQIGGGADPYVARTNALQGAALAAPTGSYGGRAESALDAIRTAIGSGAPSIDPAYGASTNRIRESYLSGLEGLQGPDRNALAAEAFKAIQAESDPAFQAQLREVGRKNAATGRIGSGMATSDLGDVAQRRNEFLGNRQADLSREAAGLTLDDRLKVTGALGEGFNTLQTGDARLSGLGNAAYGSNIENLDRLFRNELALSESNRGYGLDLGQFYSGLGNQSFATGQELRNELRGERDYQTDASERGIDRTIQQRMLEEDLIDRGFNRNDTEANTSYRIGYGQDPTDAMRYAGNQYQAQADEAYGGVEDLLGEYILSRGQKKPPAGGSTSGSTVGNTYYG